ncbi:MAG: formylglycine-generating enzyme family protein [Pseudomonadota bacterium]
MAMGEEAKGCCAPARSETANRNRMVARPARPFHPVQTITVPGGSAIIGTSTPVFSEDGEGPLRRKKIKPFQISATTITNEAFAQFVADTGYQTEAERIGWSFVFHSDVPATLPETQGVVGLEWWRKVDGASWSAPNGPGTDHAGPDHPVVQVSWNDAKVFASWCGGRLPSEAEWEHAARGGLGDEPFPWGQAEPNDTSFTPCNIWQGRFPTYNSAADGFARTAPAKSFEPNGYGLYNMVGNVWEWTAEPYRVKSLKKNAVRKMEGLRGYKLLKGGSFLCHRSYCFRYRIAARIGNSPDSTTPHQGFRVVWDPA